MKKPIKNWCPVLLLLLATLTVSSCHDEWNDHYYTKSEGKIDMNLYDYIQSRNDMTIFANMLRVTGYDTILNKSETFTVWVPVNSTWDSAVLQDTSSWKNIVENLIARYSIPVPQADSQIVTMLNDKKFLFKSLDTTATFGGYLVGEKDKATFNGLVQVMNNYVPYHLNQWENIMSLPGIDSLRNYVISLNDTTLDQDKSYDNGVFIGYYYKVTNKILTYLGDLNLEDSIYTTILPDNSAWTEAYNRISPYFKTLPSSGGTATQRANTLWSMTNDLIFRGRISQPVPGKKMLSTNFNRFADGDSLLMGAEKAEQSNGFAYKTSKLTHKPYESWCQEIRVEAEDVKSNETVFLYSLSIMSSLGTAFKTSDDYYITCLPKTASAVPTLNVRFPIPNTLSAKYNIYMVFVPTSIVDTLDKRPYKCNFFISHVNSTGLGKVLDLKLNTTPLVTNPTSMTKLLIAKNYTFPFSNLMKGTGYILDKTTVPTVDIKVTNAAAPTGADLKNFNRTLRIDCLILEPVDQ